MISGTLMIAAPSLSVYPGYTGDLSSVSGTVLIRADGVDSTSQILEWSLDGIDAACTPGAGDDVANGCGIHVHTGTSCAVADDVGGHYWNGTLLGEDDPWADIVYEVTSGSYSSGSQTVTTGLTLSDMEGRVFVVHELTNGARIACGVLSGSSLTTSVSTFSTYPDYKGDYTSVSGTVMIRAPTDDSALQLLDWDLQNIDPLCAPGAGDDVANGCGIHVHTGTSCAVADDVGGHYWNEETLGDDDPWADIVYTTATTSSSGNATVMTGLRLSQLVGRVFVVHELTNGARIACGILQAAPTMVSVSSGLGLYPDYDGGLAVTGVITLTGDATQTLKWDLAGLDPACEAGAGAPGVPNGCGIHVHTGTSCDVAADVGGHYWDEETLGPDDPWADVVYVTDGSGRSTSSTTVGTELLLWKLAGRAFVVHDVTGARVGCGVLVAGEMTSVGSFSAYPDYTGSLTSVAGTVTIASSGVVSQVLTWNLTDVDPACTFGAGDEVANGCGIHVHTGTAISPASQVGGHYYALGLDPDPWAVIRYAVGTSWNGGRRLTGANDAAGAAEVDAGLLLADMVGHAFVVHELADGARIAIGIVGREQPACEGESHGCLFQCQEAEAWTCCDLIQQALAESHAGGSTDSDSGPQCDAALTKAVGQCAVCLACVAVEKGDEDETGRLYSATQALPRARSSVAAVVAALAAVAAAAAVGVALGRALGGARRGAAPAPADASAAESGPE